MISKLIQLFMRILRIKAVHMYKIGIEFDSTRWDKITKQSRRQRRQGQKRRQRYDF